MGLVALPISLAYEGDVHVVSNDTVAKDMRL